MRDLNNKPVLRTLNDPEDSDLVEWVHKVIYNIIVTKDIDNKLFDYIDPWGETLGYIAWTIRAYYHHTIGATSGQAVFCRDMIFNLTSVVD